MKHAGHYLLAGLLVLATVPIYRFILTRNDQVVSAGSTFVRSSVVSAPGSRPVVDCSSSHSAECVSFSNGMDATLALRDGRAKCVAGTVYRVYGHVIEPWPPGNLGCDDPYAMRRSARGVGVQPLR